MDDIEDALNKLQRAIEAQGEIQDRTNDLLYALNESVRAAAQEIADLQVAQGKRLYDRATSDEDSKKERVNYNRTHVHSGYVLSGSSDGQLTVGDLRDAIAEFTDDALVVFGPCEHGTQPQFWRFKARGDNILSVEFGG